MVMVERVGRDIYDVETGLLVHIDGGGIAVFGRDLPFIAELLESLRVDVGNCDQINVLAAPVAGGMGKLPAAQSADWPGADDADSDFGF